MGGAGIVGSGGIGVGGWQIYEEVNPSTHRQLSRQGYQWNPAKIPLADEAVPQDNKKFEWKSWGCVDKLFKDVSITHTESSTTSSQTPSYTNLQNTSGDSQVSNHQKKMYLTTPVNFSNNLLACALFDYRGGSDVSTNKIYFKSEVAVQDENHGWIMWSGLSNTPSNTPSNKSDTITLEYRLLTLKKNGSNWEIDKGFGWSSPTNSVSDSSQYKLQINLPAGDWTIANTKVGNGYSTRKIWSGIAKVDSASNQHLVESLNIHQKSTSDEAKKYGFWGRKEGKWLASEDGYDKANKMYVKDQGWQTLSQTIDLGDTLTEWYKPLRGGEDYSNPPNVKWMTCDQWSGNRGTYSSEDSWNKTMQEMCYTKP